MLYALGDPFSLLVLLVSFVVAVTLLGWTSSTVAARTGERWPRAEQRTRPDPRRHLDPFGSVAAAIAGIGWARPVEPPDRRYRGRVVAVLLSGPVVVLLVGIACLVALAQVSDLGRLVDRPSLLLQSGTGGGIAPVDRVLLLLGLAHLMTGLLALVPLPPLPGGRLLLALAPRTPGWQKAEYQLVERNLGIAVLLALLLIPLGGPQALLPTLLDTIAGPLVRLVAGA